MHPAHEDETGDGSALREEGWTRDGRGMDEGRKRDARVGGWMAAACRGDSGDDGMDEAERREGDGWEMERPILHPRSISIHLHPASMRRRCIHPSTEPSRQPHRLLTRPPSPSLSRATERPFPVAAPLRTHHA